MWIHLLIGSAFCLVSCQFQGRVGRSSWVTAGQQAVNSSDTSDSRPLAVIITGFQAPGTLYQNFELEAKRQGMETLIVEVPAAGTSPLRQDQSLVSALEQISIKLPPTAQRQRGLYLFGHSLGGKIATVLALLDSNQSDTKVTQQIGGYVHLKNRHLSELQKALRGVFLLDPVYDGVDTYLVKRLQIESGVDEGSLMSSAVRAIDSALVSVPIEKMKPRVRREPGLRVSIVQAELGRKGKSAAELAEAAQAFRRSLGALTTILTSTESWVARQVQHEAPPCGPDFILSDGLSLPGAQLAYGLFADRAAVPEMSAARLKKYGLTDRESRPLPEDRSVQVHTIGDAGHMDVVDLQPFQYASHQKFVRLCATGPAIRQALVAGNPKSGAHALHNPYHEQAVALWRDFLGQQGGHRLGATQVQ